MSPEVLSQLGGQQVGELKPKLAPSRLTSLTRLHILSSRPRPQFGLSCLERSPEKLWEYHSAVMSISVKEAKARYPGSETFKFGDSRELCDHLIFLIRAGKKRATCGSLSSYKAEDEPMPVIGRRDIALNWDGTPELVIETTGFTIRRFCDVDAEFALAEGENETLEGWQAGHRAFFERNGGWTPEMELVCEHFSLVEDFAR